MVGEICRKMGVADATLLPLEEGLCREGGIWWPRSISSVAVGVADLKTFIFESRVDLCSIMKNDSERVAMPFADLADAMTKRDPIITPVTANGTVVNSEQYRVPLDHRNDSGARLHAWPLFGQHTFALATTAPAASTPGRFRPPDKLLAFLEAL